MSCTLATAVAGDVDDVRRIALSGGELNATDLVGATVQAHVWPSDGSGSPVDLAGSVVDAARKIIAINLGGAAGWLATLSVPAEGQEFNIEYEITFADLRVWTWPSNEPDVLFVRAQGD